MTSVQELAANLAKPPRLLVVDDDYYIHVLFERIARVYELDVVIASNPVEGIKELDKGEFTAVFLDLKFPGSHDGMEVLREINKKTIDTRVIIMSGSVNLHDVVVAANHMGVVSFMVKPVPMVDDFMRTILRRLGLRVERRTEPLLPSQREISAELESATTSAAIVSNKI